MGIDATLAGVETRGRNRRGYRFPVDPLRKTRRPDRWVAGGPWPGEKQGDASAMDVGPELIPQERPGVLTVGNGGALAGIEKGDAPMMGIGSSLAPHRKTRRPHNG